MKNYVSLVFATTMAMIALKPASASPLLFNFSGPSGTAIFRLDSNPKPDYVKSFSFLPGSDQFGFNGVSGTFDGVAGTASTINFGEGLFASLNIIAPGLSFTQFSSPTLFTGSASMPMFAPGTFVLVNPFFGNGTLVISALPVPEASDWSISIIGLGVGGAAIRYRHRRRPTDTFA